MLAILRPMCWIRGSAAKLQYLKHSNYYVLTENADEGNLADQGSWELSDKTKLILLFHQEFQCALRIHDNNGGAKFRDDVAEVRGPSSSNCA